MGRPRASPRQSTLGKATDLTERDLTENDGRVADDSFDIVPVVWRESAVEMLDQRSLPATESWLTFDTADGVADAIRDLVVRGAPAIGVAAGYGLALAGLNSNASSVEALDEDLRNAAKTLLASRPTAVNLAWAVGRVLDSTSDATDVDMARSAAIARSHEIARVEHESCKQIGLYGLQFVPDTANLLTHCNAGALATGGYGTALGVIRASIEAGKDIHVWVDETRPVLQGARLTAWELERAGIPNTLIVDSAAASLFSRGLVDVAVVGADRIAANGDVANKIGTYSVALAAAAHDVPLIVAAPRSTVDISTPSGAEIPIEERQGSEVVHDYFDTSIAPEGEDVLNMAFDVTPAELVHAIVTEVGVALPPFTKSLRGLMDIR